MPRAYRNTPYPSTQHPPESPPLEYCRERVCQLLHEMSFRLRGVLEPFSASAAPLASRLTASDFPAPCRCAGRSDLSSR